MEMLNKAVKAGFNNGEHKAKDSDLDPLRVRADFQALLASLQPKAKETPRATAPPPRAKP